jgi:VanZ family protein
LSNSTGDLNNSPGDLSHSTTNAIPNHVWIHAVVWRLTALAWAGFIFYMSMARFSGAFTGWLLSEFFRSVHVQVSPPTFDLLHHLMRKLAHVTEYCIFSMLLYGSAQEERPFEWRPRRALGCVLVAGAYSLTDEFHQIFVPGRGPSLIDCGIDTTGATLGSLVFYGRKLLSR